MNKTTVYLSDGDRERLRMLAADTGCSQADLIREGVRNVLAAGGPKRTFHSMGAGDGPGGARPRWDAGELHRRRRG